MARPQRIRKVMLTELFTPALDNVLVVQHIDSHGRRPLFHSAVLPHELEGMVAKQRDSSNYMPETRSPDWVKVKRTKHVFV